MSQANISLHGNRVKVYPGNTVYLKNKQEFQIELFNSTSLTRLAKIAINGRLISQTGIVVKPGQRVYLERYLDTPQKFLFETYTVEGDNQEVKQAIANNGLIQVYWYDEYIAPPPIYPSTITISNYPLFSNYPHSQFFCSSNTAGSGQSFTTTSNSSKISASASTDWMEQAKERSFTGDLFNEEEASAFNQKKSLKETGKIEMGSNSNQQFYQYKGEFNLTIVATTTIKILPLSEKPLEAKDLASYCTNCGSKNKGGKFKYCPTCGTKY